MKSVAMERLELEMDLRTALDENQFFLLYQPIFDFESVNVCGVEALLRWRHPARGIVEPDVVHPDAGGDGDDRPGRTVGARSKPAARRRRGTGSAII